jgi:hypothetical protein
VRALAAAIVALLVVSGFALVLDDGNPLPPAGARVTVAGVAMVVHLDGSSEELASGDVVRAGEEVRVEAGNVALELADGGVLEGRAGTGDDADTRIVVDATPELVAGELLMVGDPGLAVDAAGTIVYAAAANSAARVERELAVTAKAYRGALEIDSAGQDRSVPALRQLGIASLGRPPTSPSPIDLLASDPWDRRFLGEAIDVGGRLDSLSAAFTAEHQRPMTETDIGVLLPALASEPELASWLRDDVRLAGEVLVGAAMVTLGASWDDTFAFRDDGAGWGVVALDRGLDPANVFDAVQDALGRDDEVPDVALPTPTTSPTTPTTTSSGTGGPATTAPPATSPPTSAPTTPTTAPPLIPPTTPPFTPPTLPPNLPPPLPPPPDDLVPDTGIPIVDDTVEPIEDLITGLLD